jgi:hypothetical protein
MRITINYEPPERRYKADWSIQVFIKAVESGALFGAF